MIKSIVNKKVIFSFVICICLIMISGIFIGANVFHYINYMDSDIASDTLLTLSLAILGGLQGMHVIAFAFAPIAGSELLRLILEYIYDKKFYKKGITIWAIVVFVTSFLVTSLTGSDSSNKHRNIRHSIEKFTQIIFPQIRGVISIDGNNKFWVTALCIIGVIGYILLIRDTIKETKNDHDRLTDKWA